MRQVIESYALILIVALLCMLAIAFTSINLNIIQARRIYSDIRAEVQASNGAIVPLHNPDYYNRPVFQSDPKYMAKEKDTDFRRVHHYGFAYTIERQSLTDTDHDITADTETYIYNSIYKINFIYVYNVPLFGQQVYPIVGFVA